MFNILSKIKENNPWKVKAKNRSLEIKNLKKENERLKNSRERWKQKANKYKQQNIELDNELKKN